MQTVHIKWQALFSLKIMKNKYFKMSSAAVVIGALKVDFKMSSAAVVISTFRINYIIYYLSSSSLINLSDIIRRKHAY